MPEIARFLGIVVRMYYCDHEPPHFHVRYNSCRAVFSIADISLISGFLPPKVLSFVLEWAFIHRGELMANWKAMLGGGPLKKIDPLE